MYKMTKCWFLQHCGSKLYLVYVMGSVHIASPAGTNKYFTVNLLARLHFLHKRATTLGSPDWIVQPISKTVYVVLVYATFRET